MVYIACMPLAASDTLPPHGGPPSFTIHLNTQTSFDPIVFDENLEVIANANRRRPLPFGTVKFLVAELAMVVFPFETEHTYMDSFLRMAGAQSGRLACAGYIDFNHLRSAGLCSRGRTLEAGEAALRNFTPGLGNRLNPGFSEKFLEKILAPRLGLPVQADQS